MRLSATGFEEIPGRTTGEVQYEQPGGNVDSEVLSVQPLAGSLTPVSSTKHGYDMGHRILTTVNGNSRTAYQAGYVGDRLSWETDETGVTTTYSNRRRRGSALESRILRVADDKR